MVLRIEQVSDGKLTILRLSGRLQSEHVDQLKAQLEDKTHKTILDLQDVRLVDQEAVSFLEACEASGVELSQCPPYIREWIDRERYNRRV
jgi:anti-anti-sigma regulatory factor